MDKINSQSFGYLVNNDNEELFNCMRSSRTFNTGFGKSSNTTNSNTTTITKQAWRQSKMDHKQIAYESIENLDTTKKLVFTPVKKQKIEDNNSKQTLFNGNLFADFKEHKNPFITYQEKAYEKIPESNKENSNLRSNQCPFSSSNTSNSHGDDSDSSSGFKMPNKNKRQVFKYDNIIKDSKFLSVKVNLQHTFNKDSGCTTGIFPNIKQEDKFNTHSLISGSSNSASQDDSLNNSKEDVSVIHNNNSGVINYNSNEKEIILDNTEKLIPFSQATVTESFLDGFNNKTFLQIPKERSNDEKFKILAIKKLRKHTHKDNKSTSKAETHSRKSWNSNENVDNLNNNNINSQNSEYSQNSQYSNPESMLEFDLFNKKRRKIVHSVKRIYASEIGFFNPTNEREQTKFRIYKDSEIGFNPDWQKYLRESKADEDILTDEELLSNAQKFTQKSLMESIMLVSSDKECSYVNNLSFLQKKK
jgi:hypothetical protein